MKSSALSTLAPGRAATSDCIAGRVIPPTMTQISYVCAEQPPAPWEAPCTQNRACFPFADRLVLVLARITIQNGNSGLEGFSTVPLSGAHLAQNARRPSPQRLAQL